MCPPQPTNDPNHRPTLNRRPPAFRPRFTISIAYLAGFTLLFSILLVLPDLLEVLSRVSDDQQRYDMAMAIAQKKSQPRLALFLALLATGLGGYFEVLPGLREG